MFRYAVALVNAMACGAFRNVGLQTVLAEQLRAAEFKMFEVRREKEDRVLY